MDPAQTVNTTTGEMGFTLPLGVVEGVNGHHAPINLNYSAGIQLHQPSSNIGLGFTSLPGVITIQAVLVPDEIKQYSDYRFEQNGFYHIQPWYWVATGILMVATIIIAVFTYQYEIPALVMFAITTAITTGDLNRY